MRSRTIRALAGAATALALLSGCVAIPTGGPVQTAQLDTDPEEVPNVALPDGPVSGQSPVELVQGFVRAGRAPQNGYSVAELFLTPDAEWSGTERVLVTSSAILPVAVDDDTVSLTVTVVGEVDARGVYTARSPQAQTLSYDFETVDGEYRISRADPGTVLSRNGFQDAFEPYPLYFYDQTFQYLIPDLRWFPQIPRTVPDRIVSELLAGPAAWLAAPVAISAFPSGTTGQAVYDAPRVEVELDAAVRAEQPITQRRMIDQIEQSLFAGLGRNITGVDISAGGLALAPAPASEPAPEQRYRVQELFGGLEGSLGTLGSEGVTPLTGIGGRADEFQPRAASLSRDRRSVAVLGPAGVVLVDAAAAPALVDARAGLVAPSLDVYGFAWTVPADDPGGLVATAADGVQHPVALPLDGRVVSIDVSRDGARLLVALDTPSGPRLVLLGIQRDADLVPTGYGPTFDLPVTEGILDATWVDATSVAVLLAGDDAAEVEVHPVGGPVRSLGAITGGVQVVGGADVDSLRVLTSDGVVHRPVSAGGWLALETRASFLGTQQ